MWRIKAKLRQLAERNPEFLNPLWKVYYKYNRSLKPESAHLHQNRQLAFQTIHQNNFWGSDESVSGSGSTFNYTRILRKQLPRLLTALNVQTFLDAPCGDFNWMRHVPIDNIKYIGCDIVKELIERLSKEFSGPLRTFQVLDIVDGEIPIADLWMCRDSLFHLSNADCMRVLHQFANSKIEYFLSTTFDISKKNVDITSGGFRHLNLCIAPFNLPRPLRSIDDFVAPFAPRSLGLWNRDQVKSVIS